MTSARSVRPTVVSGPANGTATVEADGSITYAPTPGFTGTDTFDYQICSTVTPTVCATATVTIDVGAVPNQPPVVGDAKRRDDRHGPGDRKRDGQRPGRRPDGHHDGERRPGERHRHRR